MNDIFQKIKSAKHIEIVVDKDQLFVASALYSYVLTLHKKVSLVCKAQVIDLKFSFLPWIDKIKKSDTPSADYSVKLTCSALELYESFSRLKININKKMATALYGAVLNETNGFTNTRLNGTIFAVCNELIECKAEYKLATDFVLKYGTLGVLRLKSKMLANMILLNDAKVAVFTLANNDLKATSTLIEDAEYVMLEAFTLAYVDTVVLLDNENEVIKILNKEI